MRSRTDKTIGQFT